VTASLRLKTSSLQDLCDRYFKRRFSDEAHQQSTMGKRIWWAIDVRNFGSDVSVCPSVRTYIQTLGDKEGSPQGNPTGIMPPFLGGKSPGAFGQPTIFFCGRRSHDYCCFWEKSFFSESLSLFGKRFFESTGALYLRWNWSNILKWKEKL